jgi:hypothetical protein
MVRKVLLVCGILSSLLYVATDILAAMRYEGYSYTSQGISELMAVGAPTRLLMVAMSFVYNPLVIAFGMGVWLSAGPKRSLRVTGILVVAYGVVSSTGPLFPMQMRGAGSLTTDAMHLILTSVLVLLLLLSIGFGGAARGGWFRLYSIGTILTLLVCGVLAGQQAPQAAAGLPTPWLGVIERVNVYGWLLWMLVFAVVLLRGQEGAQPRIAALGD